MNIDQYLKYIPSIIIRSLFLILVFFFINYFIQSDTSSFFITSSIIIAVTLATSITLSKLNTYGFWVLIFVLTIAIFIIYKYLDYIAPTNITLLFTPYLIQQQILIIYAIFIISLISTWYFWRKSWYLSFEMFLLVFLGIITFSAHRNYHLDFPKIITKLAWYFETTQLLMFIVVGIGIVAFIAGYLFFSTAIRTKLVAQNSKIELSRAAPQIKVTVFVIIVVIVLTSLIGQFVYKHYQREILTRIANGVGMSEKEGMSPLGFHSSLGGSSQPAAFVRLEGDYKDNPFSPFLFFRESALSSFNGIEMVVAGRGFDSDVSFTSPFEAYDIEDSAELLYRSPLTQSVYLLTLHDNVFAVDYPQSIRVLKNPDTNRFKGAYRAYSYVPVFSINKLIKEQIGNSNWDKTQKEHYLKKHPDFRYKDLAHKIIGNEQSPLMQAVQLADYLSKNTIYTLTPNHQVSANSDPVAPYLFGDMRGYCVHFAHALVYMLRALDIPSRIGTGYLTDLSQSKDGHILLRLSDRHAWAEVYFDKIGWVPFDVQPAQVENHASSDVDMQLLEELMSLLEPGEEILPKENIKDELNSELNEKFKLPDVKHVLQLLILIVCLLYLYKLYCYYGWFFASSPTARVKRLYYAILCRLSDLGYNRGYGETHLEYRARLKKKFGSEILMLSDEFLKVKYSNQTTNATTVSKAKNAYISDAHILSKQPFAKKLFMYFNLKSTTLLKFIVVLCILTAVSPVYAQVDPYDSLSYGNVFADEGSPIKNDEESDKLKDSDTLIAEAAGLMLDNRLLDGRTKLLRALQKDPKNYLIHILLSEYYIAYVGHYRLALKYVKQATNLFQQQKGLSPYLDPKDAQTNAQLLYLLAQVRLSLDNYQGSLDAINQFEKEGFYGGWLPSTKAWVLMKLGRLNEAIQTARMGVLFGSESGRTLNVLGVLLSMVGEPENALKVFAESVEYEFALGSNGQPSSPLNNSGEVFREMFREDQAERMFLRAISLPDGCQHVLPTINLALLYIEQLKFKQAEKVLDDFMSCVAQYPLKNGEEHKVLIALMRGRIQVHTGRMKEGIENLFYALNGQQWFGSMGTNIEDLKSGATISMAQALKYRANHNKYKVAANIHEKFINLKNEYKDRIHSWWLMERGVRILISLKNIEDINIRNTDSMLEYSTFGEALSLLSSKTLKKRIDLHKKEDHRPNADIYYSGYIAENIITNDSKDKGLDAVKKVIERTRPVYDTHLKLQMKLLELQNYDRNSAQYLNLIREVYETAPAKIRNYGLRFPVNSGIENKEVLIKLDQSIFIINNDKNLNYRISYDFTDGQHKFIFTSNARTITTQDPKVSISINKLMDSVFSEF